MNISTNYNNIQAYQMRRTTPAVKLNQSAIAVNNQNSPSFTGIKNFMFPIKNSLIPHHNEEFNFFVNTSAGILDKEVPEIKKLLHGKTFSRVSFFADTVEKYNRQNFYRTAENKENSDIVFKLFNQVKNPSKAHRKMTANTDLSLKQESIVFERLQNNPKKINHACDIYADINKSYISEKNPEEAKNIKNKVFMQIIESPNSDKYLSDYEVYRPYIKQNIQKEDVISKLDAKILSKSYDKDFADKSYKLDEVYGGLYNRHFMPKDKLMPYFSEEGNELLTYLDHSFTNRKGIHKIDEAGITNIYKTTTDKNLEIRKKFLKETYYHSPTNKEYNEEEIENVNKLFTMMDEDHDTMQFIKKMTDETYVTLDAGGYVAILGRVKPSVLNKDSKTAVEAIRKNTFKSSEEQVCAIIDMYENKPQSYKDKCITKFKNLFVKNDAQKQVPVSVPAETIPKNVFQSNLNKEIAVSDEFQSKNKIIRRKTGYTPRVEAAPSAKKLVVINDVNEVIKKKLGKNVYDDQHKTYARYATKMRLKLLPEIFDSVKDTRAAARIDGTFNRKTTVKNEDALFLYRRINGKNRRLVNYMLKLRNKDGSRKYNIKDIIETIDNTEKAARERQMISPKDRKKCFDAVLNEKIAEFGKLPVQRVSKAQSA